jgi:hypothetical protein
MIPATSLIDHGTAELNSLPQRASHTPVVLDTRRLEGSLNPLLHPSPHFAGRAVPHRTAMPLLVISEVQAEAGLKRMSDELMFLLAAWGHLGVTKLSTFANLEANEEGFRKMLADDMGLVSSEGMAVRITIASLIGAWQAAKQRLKTAEETAAEARATGQLPNLPKPTVLSIRRSHEIEHGELDDREFPSKDYLAMRLDQMEDGDYRAESLTEVVSIHEAGDANVETSCNFQVTSTGRIAATRLKVRVPPPSTPEELRATYRLMRTHWEVMRQKHPDRLVFAAASHDPWEKLVSYLLGPEVHGYRSGSNHMIAWKDLLEYEYQIRKAAFKKVTKGEATLADALNQARKDPELFSRYFTMQLVTSGHRDGRKKDESSASSSNKRALAQELAAVKRLREQWTNSKGKGGRNKGRRGGKGEATRADDVTTEMAVAESPIQVLSRMRRQEKFKNKLEGKDGKNICSWFQTGNCKFTAGTCRFAHVCLRCHSDTHGCIDPRCPKMPK